MPEEKEQTPNEGQNPSGLDQETLDQMLADSQGDADQLESMLNNLEDASDSESEPGDGDGADLSELADDMEAMLERMEGTEAADEDNSEDSEDDDVSDLNDMLYQATLADVEQSQPGEQDSDDLDLDEALEALDEEDDDPVEDLVAEAEEGDDSNEMELNALLEDAENEDEDALTDMLEGVEDEVPEDVAALEDDAMDDMLDAAEAEEEAEPDGLDAMLEEIDEEANTTEDEEPSDEDLEALLDDGEEDAESLDEETAEELSEDDLTSMLDDDDTESEADASEEDLDAEDLEALLEDEDTSEGDDAEDELASMLEDVDDDTEADASEEDLDAEDLEALLDDEDPEDDLTSMLDDVEEDAESDAEESEEDAESLDALLEDVDEDVLESEDAEDDLASLLDDAEDEDAESLDALLEDEDTSDGDEDVESLDALLEDVEEDMDDDVISLEDDDLDALLGDEDDDLDMLLEDVDEEETSDEDLDDLLASASEESTDDVLETTEDLDDLLDDMDLETEPTDDLDDLFDDLNTDDDLLNVGVEDEVAQILATGESSGDDSILDEFKSVQETFSSPLSSGDDGGILLMIDGDADQRSLFEDALDNQYDFVDADTLSEGLQILHNEHVDLILLNLDDDEGGALEFVEQVNASLDMPAIPIIVTSEDTDLIEKALRLGAVDYLTRPLDIMDLEFQVPQKVANQMKLQKAERILAGSGSASVLDSPEVDSFDLDEDDDLDLDDLLADDDSSPEDMLVRPSSKKDPLIPLSDQQKILRNKKTAQREVSRIPLFAGLVALLVAAVGAVYHYQDEIKNLLPLEENVVTQAPPRPKQPLPKVKMPEVPKQNYATTPTPPPARSNVFQQQADVLKSRIRQNVQELADNGGAWWSPWRVMRASGASVSGLVDRQSVQDILGAFNVDMGAVERGLQSARTLDYLASVGFDLRGRDASDLSAREAFELLSARQIKNADQIVDVLSNLTDRLAEDRTAQEEHKEQERRRRKGQAMLQPLPEVQELVSQRLAVVTETVDALQADVVTRSVHAPYFKVGWSGPHRT